MQLKTDRMIAEKDAGIGWMTFNSPARHNAVSFEMWEAVPDILDNFAADDSVRVAVVSGAGDKAFVFGADISEFNEKRSGEDAIKIYNDAVDRANRALHEFEKPLIAMIRGYCLGGGVGIAINADIRIAADDSRFGVPAARLGLGYAYPGIRNLMDLVGPAYAKDIFFTAKRYSAAEALTMGLVNWVVPVDELESAVRDYATTIAANAPLTVKAVKAIVGEAVKNPDDRDLARLDAMVDACFASQDYIEGRTAFMEKREPVFVGR